MKIKVEFVKGIDEHELGEIKSIYYGKSDSLMEAKIELIDIDGKALSYWISDILMLSAEE